MCSRTEKKIIHEARKIDFIFRTIEVNWTEKLEFICEWMFYSFIIPLLKL